MEDAKRILEQQALRNTRSLVDTLEQEETAARRKQKYLVLLAVAPVLLVFWALYHSAIEGAKKVETAPGSAILSPCVSNVVASRSEAFENDLRRANPDMTRRERMEKLARERPFFIATGKIECSPAAR